MDATTEFSFFQTAGADETLAAAKAEFESKNPRRWVTDISFYAAYPREGKGRWIDLLVTHRPCNWDFATCKCPECRRIAASWDEYNENRRG